jgi:hypothetical protein
MNVGEQRVCECCHDLATGDRSVGARRLVPVWREAAYAAASARLRKPSLAKIALT